MTAGTTVAAIDLGAESGRVASVQYDGQRLRLSVQHRFAHTPVDRDGILRWDLDRLWDGIRAGLEAVDRGPAPIASIGVDCWGVDYGLVSAGGELVDTPTCYRDGRNLRAMRKALGEVGSRELYDATGVQIIPINTVFALHSDVTEHPDRLAKAETLLMMPDVVHHLLCGSTVTEHTAASTSGLLDMRTGAWAEPLAERLGIPRRILPPVVPAGTELGRLSGYRGSLRDTRVIAPPAHDTASAVVATPFQEPGSLFISSGTWSLVGVEVERAVVTEDTRLANLTNEGGYAGTVRLLRNVMGLWILQCCRRQWAGEGHDLSYEEIAAMAAQAPGLVSLVNPDADDFLAPGDMPTRIQKYCARNGEPVPRGVAEIARCVIDSLALGYRDVVEAIATCTGRRPGAVNIVGGGSSHALLSQLTADATGLPVHCGPVEATALGNAAVQLVTLGRLGGLDDIRAVVAASTRPVTYQPRASQDWSSAADRFSRLRQADLAASGLTGLTPASRAGGSRT